MLAAGIVVSGIVGGEVESVPFVARRPASGCFHISRRIALEFRLSEIFGVHVGSEFAGSLLGARQHEGRRSIPGGL